MGWFDAVEKLAELDRLTGEMASKLQSHESLLRQHMERLAKLEQRIDSRDDVVENRVRSAVSADLARLQVEFEYLSKATERLVAGAGSSAAPRVGVGAEPKRAPAKKATKRESAKKPAKRSAKKPAKKRAKKPASKAAKKRTTQRKPKKRTPLKKRK